MPRNGMFIDPVRRTGCYSIGSIDLITFQNSIPSHRPTERTAVYPSVSFKGTCWCCCHLSPSYRCFICVVCWSFSPLSPLHSHAERALLAAIGEANKTVWWNGDLNQRDDRCCCCRCCCTAASFALFCTTPYCTFCSIVCDECFIFNAKHIISTHARTP